MSTVLMILIVLLLAAIDTGENAVAPQAQGGLTLTLIRKPFPSHEHQNLIQLSKSRALSFRRPPAPTKTTVLSNPNNISAQGANVPIQSPVIRGFSGLYYTEVYAGTPPLKVNLVVDSGSSPTWVQSARCQECFPVSLPNFHPNSSTTYQRMPFDHPLGLPLWLTPSGPFCSYEVSYMGNQVTTGDFGLDSFTFVSTKSHGLQEQKEQAIQIPDVAFGCGVHNHILDFVQDAHHVNPISGILGLGRDHPSGFLLQLSSITLLKFSYCLPQNTGDQASLCFGNDAELVSPEIQTTPILGSSHDFYSLNLTGISLKGSLLPIDPKLFMPYGDYGVVIDSGSEYSLFVPEAYKILRQAMVSYFFEEYSWAPMNKSRSGFDLCYDLSDMMIMRKEKLGGLFSVAPPMIFHFQGANLELNEATTFQVLEEFNEFCMMIEPNDEIDDVNILGAFLQLYQRFLFDVAASKLSFAPEKC